jgi:hypothetical protein
MIIPVLLYSIYVFLPHASLLGLKSLLNNLSQSREISGLHGGVLDTPVQKIGRTIAS